jgi:hypothetical protein
MPKPSSQSHSQVDLSHTTNGNLDGSKMQPWDSTKTSGDSNITRSDVSRNSSWWRQMSTKRGPRDARNGNIDGRGQHQEAMLDTSPISADATTSSPTFPSPGRRTTSGKIMSFFKRRPRPEDQEKQLSSFGSSSQLRTPPTSDPGRLLGSDD